MNNEDKQLLEDFLNYLTENNINPMAMENVEIAETVSTFMSSNKYVPRPVDVISTTNLPTPHFDVPKITL